MSISKLATSTGRGGIISGIRFIVRHWYIVTLFLILLPSIITSINVAIDTQNPSYPFIQLGLRLTNADAVIYDDVELLKENPAELIGMEKPTHGIIEFIKYYWLYFWNVIFELLANVWLIFFPLLLIYKVVNTFNVSKPTRNKFISVILFMFLVFAVNLIILVHGVVKGDPSMIIPENLDFSGEVWWIMKSVLPFRGMVSLGIYLFSLFSGK